MEPGYDSQIEDIIKSVKSGKLKESDMDICVRRILELCVRSPKMNGVAFSNKPDLKAHAQVTRQSAAEGMVLLKVVWRSRWSVVAPCHRWHEGRVAVEFVAGIAFTSNYGVYTEKG